MYATCIEPELNSNETRKEKKREKLVSAVGGKTGKRRSVRAGLADRAAIPGSSAARYGRKRGRHPVEHGR